MELQHLKKRRAKKVKRDFLCWRAHTRCLHVLFSWKDFIFSSSYDGTLKQWNSEGELIRAWTIPTDFLHCAAIHSDHLFVQFDQVIEKWDLNGNKVKMWNKANFEHPFPATNFEPSSFCTWNQWLCISWGCKILRSNDELKDVQFLSKHEDRVSNLVVWNGKLVSASEDGIIKLWNQDRTCHLTLSGHKGIVQPLCVYGNYLFSGDMEGIIRKWDFSGNFLFEIEDETPVHTMIILDNFLYSGSDEGYPGIKKWDMNGKLLQKFGEESWVLCLCIFQNMLFSGDWNTHLIRGCKDTQLRWIPKNHAGFSSLLRNQVKTTLMLSLLDEEGAPRHPRGLSCLPKEILFMILSFLT